MSFTCRQSTPGDALAGAEIIREWGEETPWMAPLDELAPIAASWRDLLGMDTAWVAEVAGRVAGFCVLEDDTIVGLYVARAHRRRGIGKTFLDLAKARRGELFVWAYEKNLDALRFYRREGFVEIGREVDEEDTSGELFYRFYRWAGPDQAG